MNRAGARDAWTTGKSACTQPITSRQSSDRPAGRLAESGGRGRRRSGAQAAAGSVSVRSSSCKTRWLRRCRLHGVSQRQTGWSPHRGDPAPFRTRRRRRGLSAGRQYNRLALSPSPAHCARWLIMDLSVLDLSLLCSESMVGPTDSCSSDSFLGRVPSPAPSMNKLPCHFLSEDVEVFNLKAVYSYTFLCTCSSIHSHLNYGTD